MVMRYFVTSAGYACISSVASQQKFTPKVRSAGSPAADVPLLIGFSRVPVNRVAVLKTSRERHYDAT